ncbi:MAG TPA: hypothetical protein VF234_01615, partial [Limnochordia bacterium]
TDVMHVALAVAAEMVILGGAAPDHDAARALLQARLADGSARARLAALVAAQGGDPRAVDEPDRIPLAPHAADVTAPAAGWLLGIDARELGTLVRRLAAGSPRGGEASAGILLWRKTGDPVAQGERLATVYAPDSSVLAAACRQIAGAFTIGEQQPEPHPLVLFRIAGQPPSEQPLPP